MKKKAKCFFCYSWDNLNKYPILSYLKDLVEEESNGEIEVILDKRNYKYCDDFDEKLSKIDSYDVIVPFFTPEFKSIVSSECLNRDRELIKEYKKIEELYNENSNYIFPVILAGTKDTALPKLFSRKNCPNITEWRIRYTKENKYKLSTQRKELLDKFISELIGKTKYIFYNKSIEYKDALQAIEKLFWLTDTTELPASCLVKIDIFHKIINQECYYIAGRKGSGKSTFIKNFKSMDKSYFENNYKSMIPINAEVFNHDYVYSCLIKKHISDRSILPPKDILFTFWQLYFILQSIFTIGIELEDGRIIDDKRKEIFNKMTNKLKELLSLRYANGRYKSLKGDNVPKQLFLLAASSIDEQFNNVAIDRATSKSVYPSFIGNMNAVSILETLFDIDLLEQFSWALEQCTKK